MKTMFRISALTVFAAASLLSACGDDDSSTSPTGLESSSSADSLVSSSSGDGVLSSSSVNLGAAPAASVLPWNGAQGAYSIIMDDYCAGTTDGINWAESEAASRGLVIGFAVIVGSCSLPDWTAMQGMVQRGNEPVNHSYSHSCSNPSTGACSGDEAWASGSALLALEVDSSTHLIEANSGYRPTFFGYPYDYAYADAMAEMKALGYLGARSYNMREYSNASLNPFTGVDGFSVEYDARQPASNAQYQAYGMDEYADLAASQGMWALRETHGVEDGSWGEWSKTELQGHLDHLMALRDAGQLWVATPSTVLRYIFLAGQLQWTIVQGASAYEIQWTTPADTLAKYATPIKVRLTGSWKASQAGVDLGAVVDAAGTLVSANPALGAVSLTPP